jgi:hypothetical protein
MSKKSCLGMGRRFEEFCIASVFLKLGLNLVLPAFDNCQNSNERYLNRLVTGDSRWGSRMLITFLNLIIPSFSLIAAFIFLLYTELFLTVMLLILVLSFSLVQYKINKKAAFITRSYEFVRPYSSAVIRNLLLIYKYKVNFFSKNKEIDSLFSSGRVKQEMDAFIGRYLLLSKQVAIIFYRFFG